MTKTTRKNSLFKNFWLIRKPDTYGGDMAVWLVLSNALTVFVVSFNANAFAVVKGQNISITALSIGSIIMAFGGLFALLGKDTDLDKIYILKVVEWVFSGFFFLLYGLGKIEAYTLFWIITISGFVYFCASSIFANRVVSHLVEGMGKKKHETYLHIQGAVAGIFGILGFLLSVLLNELTDSVNFLISLSGISYMLVSIFVVFLCLKARDFLNK